MAHAPRKNSSKPSHAYIRQLLEQCGYLEDADLIDCDPDLREAIGDPEYLAWLEAGAPGNGATGEYIELTDKGYDATSKAGATRQC